MTARHKQLSRTDSDDKQCREQAGLERTNFHERQVSHSKGEGEWRGASAESRGRRLFEGGRRVVEGEGVT